MNEKWKNTNRHAVERTIEESVRIKCRWKQTYALLLFYISTFISLSTLILFRFPECQTFLKFSWPCTNTSFKAKSISFGIQELNALINAIIKEIKWHIQIKSSNKVMVTLIYMRKIWIIAITISLINDTLCVWKFR